MSNRLPVIAEEIKRAHADTRAAARFSAERAMEAGRLLIEAKAALGHGEWLPWLRTNVLMSERTARGYMALAKSGLKTATVADLGLRASLARVARRKGPSLHLRAGSLITLHAGRLIQDNSHLGLEPRPEYELLLWSTDGLYAWKWQFDYDPQSSTQCWLTSTWAKAVRLDYLRQAISADGFPIEDAQVAHRVDSDDPDRFAEFQECAVEISTFRKAFIARESLKPDA